MIKDLFSQKQTLSFEVFPPKKDDEFTNAQNVLHQLSELQPDFISVTYGAGGSGSFPCTGASRRQTDLDG